MSAPAQTHDLLQIAFDRDLIVPACDSQWPEIEANLRSCPFVVIRRALPQDGLVPIGIRGKLRNQRYAAWLRPQAIVSIQAPEQLRISGSARELPAFSALNLLQQQWSGLEFCWGPTGSVGFELATGVETVSAESDLDLMVRLYQRVSREALRRMMQVCDHLSCRVDVQMETSQGAVVLREYLASPEQVLLRTKEGPVLVRDPWQVGFSSNWSLCA